MLMKMQKKLLSFVLIFSILFSASSPALQAQAAASALQKSETFVEGSTAKIKFTGNRKTVKWSVSNERVLKIVTEKRSYVKVKGLKPAKAYVYATISENTYKCKVTVEEQANQKWVVNTETGKFHYPSCSDVVGKMLDENKQAVTAKYKDMLADGYSPCGHCRPVASSTVKE